MKLEVSEFKKSGGKIFGILVVCTEKLKIKQRQTFLKKGSTQMY